MISVVGRPRPTLVYHFTSVDHLPGVVTHGLLADTLAQQVSSFTVEVGNQGIKAMRRTRVVPSWPSGVVADYVPFYFAARSPMMYSIHRGNVPTYQEGCSRLVYLVTTVENLLGHGLRVAFTDRNAALGIAQYSTDPEDLDTLVDWELMTARDWYNTPAEPDRRERRMAECLVHEVVPWAALAGVATQNQACAVEAQAALAAVGSGATPVRVRPDWYF